MLKGMTIKEAIVKWTLMLHFYMARIIDVNKKEQKNGRKVSEVKEVKFVGYSPPIEKMDSALYSMAHLERLSLATNCIEKIAYLNLFKHLKVLSLSRNNIKSTAGLEALGEVLEELWLSYNLIERLSGIGVLKRLKVLYMSNNYVKEWSEFNKLTEVPSLEDLLFVGNPLEEKHSVDATWRKEVIKRLPNLKKLDGVPVVKETGEEAVIGVLLSGIKDSDSDQPNS